MLGANPIFGRLFCCWMNPPILKLYEGYGSKSLLLRCSHAISKWISSNIGARHDGKIQGCYFIFLFFLAGIERVWFLMVLLILTLTHRWGGDVHVWLYCISLNIIWYYLFGWLRSKVWFNHLFLGGKWSNVFLEKILLKNSMLNTQLTLTTLDTHFHFEKLL